MTVVSDKLRINPSQPLRSEPPRALKSIRLINRVLYLNGDPGLSYLLPLGDLWNTNTLADELRRACVEYDLIVTLQGARMLANNLLRQTLKDERQTNGGYQLGWD